MANLACGVHGGVPLWLVPGLDGVESVVCLDFFECKVRPVTIRRVLLMGHE